MLSRRSTTTRDDSRAPRPPCTVQDEVDALRARITAEGERVSKRRPAIFDTPRRSTQNTPCEVAILEPTHVGEPDATSENAEELYALQEEMVGGSTVSYTHLTLPTIYSV